MTTRLHENRDRGHVEWRHVHGHKHNGQATSRCASTSSRRICLVVCNLGYLLTVKAWRKLKRFVLIITENPDSSHKEVMAWSFTESSWDLSMLRWVRNQILQPSRHWSHLHSKGYHSSQNALSYYDESISHFNSDLKILPTDHHTIECQVPLQPKLCLDFGALSMHLGRKRKWGDNRIATGRRTWRL